MARALCEGFSLKNDECFGTQGNGAHSLEYPLALAYVDVATDGLNDPPVCCGVQRPDDPSSCFGEFDDCAAAHGTVWFKFQAPPSGNVRISARSVRTDPPPFIQLTAPRERSSERAACDSLAVIACGRGGQDCLPPNEGCTSLCVSGLHAGQTYYAVLGTTEPDDNAVYSVELAGGVTCGRPDGLDVDHDADTDLRDFAATQRCFSGAAGPPGCCGTLDLPPRDGLIDLGDSRTFVDSMTGPQ